MDDDEDGDERKVTVYVEESNDANGDAADDMSTSQPIITEIETNPSDDDSKITVTLQE